MKTIQKLWLLGMVLTGAVVARAGAINQASLSEVPTDAGGIPVAAAPSTLNEEDGGMVIP